MRWSVSVLDPFAKAQVPPVFSCSNLQQGMLTLGKRDKETPKPDL